MTPTPTTHGRNGQARRAPRPAPSAPSAQPTREHTDDVLMIAEKLTTTARKLRRQAQSLTRASRDERRLTQEIIHE